MSRVSEWNNRCGNMVKIDTEERKKSMLNQIERLQEELSETYAAVVLMDDVEILDGLVDMRVVLEGLVFLSGMGDIEQKAYDMVMDNNDLKWTHALEIAQNAIYVMNKDEINKYHICVFYDSKEIDPQHYYSIHRDVDDKIMKFPGHPRVDLKPLLC